MKIGDKVTVNLQFVGPEVTEMVKGKVGVIVGDDDEYWDFIVRIDDTPRAGGLFGFDHWQIRPVKDSEHTS